MKDVTQALQFGNEMSMPMVKGHTKIILTDVRSGKERVIEHDNTFQSNVLSAYLRSLGAADNNPFSDSTWAGREMWRNLCGGILLFHDAIDTSNGDVYYAPSGNQMTANGSYGIANGGTPVELGTFNSVESSLSGDSALTFVYDWSTSQGNGTISCVCLTSDVGGYIGYGNHSGVAAETLKKINENQHTNTMVNRGHAFANNKKYSADHMSSTSMGYQKWTDGITKVDVFGDQKSEIVQLPLTGDGWLVATSGGYDGCEVNGKLVGIAVQNGSIPTGTTRKIMRANPSNDTLDGITIVNTSGENLLTIGGSVISIIVDNDENVYIPDGDGTLHKFNGSGVYQDHFGEGIAYAGNAMGMLTDDVMYVVYGDNIIVFDGEHFYPTNGSVNVGSQAKYTHMTHNKALNVLNCRYNVEWGSRIVRNPLYLATVNNLDTAVVKDNTQTMKVIYTLTEA